MRKACRAPTLLLFFVASVVHGFAHAVLGVVAGRSTAVLAASAAGVNRTSSAHEIALTLGAIGTAAAFTKFAFGTLAAYGQAQLAADVGSALRLSALEGWFRRTRLRQARHSDHGQTVIHDGAGVVARGTSALTVEVLEVEVGLERGLLAGIRAAVQLVAIAGALVWISPKLTAFSAASLLPFAVFVGWARRARAGARTRTREGTAALLEAADEAIRHADLWVTFSAEERVQADVAALDARRSRRLARMGAGAAAASGANEVLGALALLSALWAGAEGWLGDVGGGARLLGFAICFFLAYRPLRDLVEARLAMRRAAEAFSEIQALTGGGTAVETLDDTPRASPRTGWSRAELVIDRLALGRGFGFPLTLRVLPGEVAVVVGPTGSGKTTLLRTLLGLEGAQSGEVSYGDERLTHRPPGLADRPFAWVPQDAGLLADTLEANVTLGNGVDSARWLDVLGAGDVARRAVDRRLGPGGVELSGGERQQVALARAFATRQPVLLLDEPTSGLDSESQARVLRAIDRMRGERAFIIVTHRREPLALADLVVTLSESEVTVTRAEPASRPRMRAVKA